MKLNLDDDAKEVILLAKDEMFSLKHPYVGSEHLLLAILSISSLRCTKFLNKFDITYDVFRNELINIIGIGSKTNTWYLFTPLLKEIINNACLKCDDFVSPDDLFSSLILSGDGVAIRLLLGMNVDYINLLNYVDSSFLRVQDLDYLNLIGENLNVKFKNKVDSIVLERDDELKLIEQVLLKKGRNNVLLVGQAGVGKSALVDEFARRIVHHEVNFYLDDCVIYNLKLLPLISNTKYRGEFEEKIRKILDSVAKSKNIILFIDEFHTIVGTGSCEGTLDVSNILKPYLSSSDIRIIGATTDYEFDKYLKKDKAICRRFQIIHIDEICRERVFKLLCNLKVKYEKYFNILISSSILNFILDITYSFFNYLFQPDVSLDFLDNVCAYCLCSNFDYKKASDLDMFNSFNLNLFNIYDDNLWKLKENMIFRDLYRIKKKDVITTIYNMIHVPLGYILELKIKKFKKKFIDKYFWEEETINKIFDYLRKILNLCEINKKILFIGDSGCGKKEIISDIFDNIFNNSNIIYIDEMCNGDLSSIENNPLNFFVCSDSLYNKIFDFIGSYNRCGLCIFIFMKSYTNNIGYVLNDSLKNDYDYVCSFSPFKREFIDRCILNEFNRNFVSDVVVENIKKEIDYNNLSFSMIRKVCLKYINN